MYCLAAKIHFVARPNVRTVGYGFTAIRYKNCCHKVNIREKSVFQKKNDLNFVQVERTLSTLNGEEESNVSNHDRSGPDHKYNRLLCGDV
jgi:hypothetical protein